MPFNPPSPAVAPLTLSPGMDSRGEGMTQRPSPASETALAGLRRARTPAFVRVLRALRLLLHFLAGLATILVVFPSCDAPARRMRVRAWSIRLLQLLHVEIRIAGKLGGGHAPVLAVANHISWLDIFVLNAVGPVRFIAKAEIARWPLVGRLVRGVGTLFIQRARRRDTHRVNSEAERALRGGDIVAVFPEGTTTDGSELLPFKGSLLQPIIAVHGVVQPVAIRYTTPDGHRSVAPAYTDVTFVGSFWRICGESALVVEMIATAALATDGRHRRELAREAERAIRGALALPRSGSAPGIHAGQASESP